MAANVCALVGFYIMKKITDLKLRKYLDEDGNEVKRYYSYEPNVQHNCSRGLRFFNDFASIRSALIS